VPSSSAGVAVGCVAVFLDDSRGLSQYGVGDGVGLACSVHPGQQEGDGALVAVRPGAGNFVGVGRWQAPGAGDADLVRAGFFEGDAAEIAGDVRKMVGVRVVDLVDELFRDGAEADLSAGFRRFGDDEVAA